ncbi:MAG: FumA C-terminus/TtdB family hydratase beta subunit [Bacteroides sp.]|nr:FumA C-terminus/TtdB family hydratase beta subunit [Bacillota bacterium]MCM1393676.1 FumA C-terminus/TtdB family hydratase beta subunit [[Eubacterium] siraeum]MCM1455225.1 FumA C-terminus/TtdB family hydratase beta subunit [Bacteroides sp.]
MGYIRLTAPFDKAELAKLRVGDRVLLDGAIYTARDAGHKRMYDAILSDGALPINLDGQAIYYVGACFDKNGKPLSAGPTTSMRMDKYAPTLYDNGVGASIGKGDRGQAVYDAIVRNKAVYLCAIGGAGATYADCIKSSTLIAYGELGTEAMYRFEVENFPLIVGIDACGNSIFKNKL